MTQLALSTLAQTIGQGSELLDLCRLAARRKDNVLGLLLRALRREEIAIMEDRGCRSDDWSLVQVAEDFDPFRVRRTHFIGSCALGRFEGNVQVMPGLTLPSGIFDSTVSHCQIGNGCLIENVRFLAHTVVEPGVILFDVGSITGGEGCTLGVGEIVSLGCESGGREVPFWPEITVAAAQAITSQRADSVGQSAIMKAVDTFKKAVEIQRSFIRRGTIIRHTRRVHAIHAGAGTLIDQAIELDQVCIYSSAQDPVSVTSGAMVRQSILHYGAKVEGGAIVRRSVLCEYAHVDKNAVIEDSLIGPNSSIGKGEVTASLVGPFTGMHHQSMLIAAHWPEGKGNIASGALVGSNHTGRAPDQEVWIGEGVFFGLGSSIRLPTDLSQAPYSLVAAGTTTLPQRVEYPFSLISAPHETLPEDIVPRAFNELMPAWGLYANAYAIVRMERKFENRDRTRSRDLPYRVLRPSTMRPTLTALKRLESVQVVKSIYTEEDLPGLGKNFLREENRQKAIQAYTMTLERYALRVLLAKAEGHEQDQGAVELAMELADLLDPDQTLGERMRRLIEVEQKNAEIVKASRQADWNRGTRIIPGYAQSHIPTEQDPIVQSALARVERTQGRIAALKIKD